MALSEQDLQGSPLHIHD